MFTKQTYFQAGEARQSGLHAAPLVVNKLPSMCGCVVAWVSEDIRHSYRVDAKGRLNNSKDHSFLALVENDPWAATPRDFGVTTSELEINDLDALARDGVAFLSIVEAMRIKRSSQS